MVKCCLENKERRGEEGFKIEEVRGGGKGGGTFHRNRQGEGLIPAPRWAPFARTKTLPNGERRKRKKESFKKN